MSKVFFFKMEPTVFSQNSFMFVSLFINTDATCTLYFYIYFVAKHVAIYNNMIAPSIVTKLSNENVLKCIYKEKLFHILIHVTHVS